WYHGIMHPPGLEPGDAGRCTQEDRALRVDLTAQRAVRHYGNFPEVGLRGHSGAGVDQVMHRVSTASPGRAAGAVRPAADRHHGLITQPDAPPIAFLPAAARAKIATQVAE